MASGPQKTNLFAKIDPEQKERIVRALQRTGHAVGYESVEISAEPAQYKVKETRALLKKYGIRCWGGVTLTLRERNLAAKDEAQRARSIASSPC